MAGKAPSFSLIFSEKLKHSSDIIEMSLSLEFKELDGVVGAISAVGTPAMRVVGNSATYYIYYTFYTN